MKSVVTLTKGQAIAFACLLPPVLAVLAALAAVAALILWPLLVWPIYFAIRAPKKNVAPDAPADV